MEENLHNKVVSEKGDYFQSRYETDSGTEFTDFIEQNWQPVSAILIVILPVKVFLSSSLPLMLPKALKQM